MNVDGINLTHFKRIEMQQQSFPSLLCALAASPVTSSECTLAPRQRSLSTVCTAVSEKLSNGTATRPVACVEGEG